MKSTYLFPLALGGVLLFLGGTYFYTMPTSPKAYQVPVLNTSSSTQIHTNSPSALPEATKPSNTPERSAGSYTMAQVHSHSSVESCWTTINGNVYDVTAWIAQHPGGATAILSLCGTDGSASFNGQHGGKPRPQSELASFKIGVLQ